MNYLINYPLKDQFRYMDYGNCRLESYTTGTANFSYLCEIAIGITLKTVLSLCKSVEFSFSILL